MENMSKRKSEDLTEQNKVQIIYKRKKSQDIEDVQHPPPSTSEQACGGDTGLSVGHQSKKLAIGSCIQPTNTNFSGTVGPFVRITDTGEICFLTARHIFGPYQRPTTFKGTEVYQNMSNGDNTKTIQRVCGHVVAAEYSEHMDVALVKISEECIPDKFQYIDVKEEQMVQAGFHTTHLPLYGNTRTSMNARDLTSQYTDIYRLVKVGSSTGLTTGIFHLEEGKVMTNEYFLKIESETSDCSLTDFFTYKNQLRVLSTGDVNFANEKDVGAAVYLVDKNNQFYCIGMICRIMKEGVLVTPIQDILQHLSHQLGHKLELVTFDSQMAADPFHACESELFDRVLRIGKENDRHIRVNIIGFYAHGKTSLTKRLLQDPLDDIESTNGIDVHIKRCKISQSGWETYENDHVPHEFSRRLVTMAHSEDVRKIEEDNANVTKFDESLDLTSPLSENQTASLTAVETNTQDGNLCKSSREEECEGGNENIESGSISTKNRTLLRHFSENLCQNKSMKVDELLLTIWDFGGQFIYYTTHQIFHSRDAIYLLVFDLNKDLDNVIEDIDFPERQEQMKNSLMFWVNSINAFVGTDDNTEPIIILVGTHKDTFKGDVDVKMDEVKNLFAGTDVRKHIYEQTFAVAIFDMEDTAIDELRNTIHHIGIKKSADKQIPANWILLEMLLRTQRETDIITFEKVRRLDANSDAPIKDTYELKRFLKYHHDKGTLVYFDEEELNEYVILNPQYLVDAFRCIVTSKSVCDRSDRLYQLWKKMTNMAILEDELLNAIWNKERFSQFSAILLNFLKRHRIVTEILKMEDVDDQKSTQLTGTGNYMIPSFLKTICTDETAKMFIRNRAFSSVILGIALENNVVLNTIYERVTAASVGRWRPIVFRDQYLVFQNVGYFRLDLQHAGKITKEDGKGIELMVIDLFSSKEDLAIVSDCFRRYVEMVVRQEFRKLHDDTREDPFSHYIKCNNKKHNGMGSKASHLLDDIETNEKVCCPDNEKHCINIRKANEWFKKEKLSENKLNVADRIVTESDLVKISQAIGSNWKLLAFELGISTDEVERIEMDQQIAGIATTIFYVLNKWKSNDPDNAYMSNLIASIESIGELTVNKDKMQNVVDGF